MQSSALLIAACALLFVAPEHPLAFRPAAETAVHKTFREQTEWTVVSMTQHVGGNSEMLEVPGLGGTNAWELEVEDELLEVEDGHLTALRRSFVGLSRSATVDLANQGYEEGYAVDLESELEGATVSFRRDAVGAEWTVEDESGGLGVLDGLSEDLDLRALLPAEELEVGDEWTVDAAELGDLFAPGGQLVFRMDGPPEGALAALKPTDVAAGALLTLGAAAGELDGRVELEWTETTEAHDEQLAVIELRVDATFEADLTDELLRLLEDCGPTVKVDPALSWGGSIEGQGELVWNLTAGRFQSLRLELEGELEVTLAWQAGSLEVAMQTGVESSTVLEASAEPADER